jgi:hypothetical protein
LPSFATGIHLQIAEDTGTATGERWDALRGSCSLWATISFVRFPGTELGEGVGIGNPPPQSKPRAQKDIPSPLFKWKDLTMGESRLCQKTAAGHHSRRATGGS